MTTPYVDPASVHDPVAGARPPAVWGDTVRDDLEFLATVPGTKCGLTGAVSIPHDTTTVVSFPVAGEVWDTDDYHSSGSPTRITIPTSFGGKYRVHCVAIFAANSVGNRGVGLHISGAFHRWGVFATGATSSTVEFHDTLILTAGAYVECIVYQNSGSALNLNSCWITVEWAGR